MRALSLGLAIAFGLGWLVAVVADLALPSLLENQPGFAGPAASTVLNWAIAQTGSAMALSVAAYFCAVAGARGWAGVALLAILPLLALAVVQFDPRINAAAQEAVGPLFNDLRAAQPQIRLGLFLGLAMIAAARILADTAGLRGGAAAVTLAVVVAWTMVAVAGAPQALAVLALPGLVLALLAAVVLARHDTAAAPFVLVGLACLLAGSALIASGASLRQDLRPGFAALVLLAALAHRLQPRLPGAVLWAIALLLAAGLAYLAPGLQQLGDVRPALSFAEVAAVLRRAEALRTGVGILMGVLVVLAVIVLRRRRSRPAA